MTDIPLELAVQRFIKSCPSVVFHVWASRQAEWWAPKPWTTTIIENDMRPGGRCAMLMSGPDGAASPMEGVYLEIVPNEKIVFTNAFLAGWIPQPPFMVGFFTFTPDQGGTMYRAGARHWTQDAYDQHVAMGFTQGWSQVADQLAALAEAAADPV